jgi:hypothetical protein
MLIRCSASCSLVAGSSVAAPQLLNYCHPPILFAPSRKTRDESRTHFAAILRYMLEGVKNSAGIDENTGTRFGGFGDWIAAAKTSRIVSSDGWTTIYKGTWSDSWPSTRIREGDGTHLRGHIAGIQLVKLCEECIPACTRDATISDKVMVY